MALRICPKCRVRQVDETGEEKCQLCRTPFVWKRFKWFFGVGGFFGFPWFGWRKRRLCPGGVCGNVTLAEMKDVPLADYCEPCAAMVTPAKKGGGA